MRDHQAHEADDAGDRHESRGREGADQEGETSHGVDVHAKRSGGIVSGEQSVELAMANLRVDEDRRGAGKRDGHQVPARQSQAAKRPEQDGMRRALVTGEDEVVRQRHEQERYGETGQNEPRRALLAKARHQNEHDRGRKHSADEGRDRKRPDTKHVSGDRDDKDRARGRT